MRNPSPHRAIGLSLLLLLGLPIAALAQTAPLNYRTQPYALDTGLHSSRPGEAAARVAYSAVVEVPGAPWLRLSFDEVALGSGSYLTVTSLYDGARQHLYADDLAQWQNTSAYFNGEALKVELHVAPGDANVFVRMDEVMVGEHGAPESQCGPTDDRVASNDERAGRLLDVGCTTWLIADGRFVTAGHCFTLGPATLVEFNVPPSLPSGALQHPGPEDQYTVDSASPVFNDCCVGNDWAVFSTFPNSETGLTALQAQGVWFDVVQDLGPPTIRITGYGLDGGTANQTQQTNAGPNFGSSGTTMEYQADTEGGNSGSPVIDDATGRSVGVHTHGGCSSSSGNFGTSTFNTAFWAQIGNTGGGDIALEGRARNRSGSWRVTLRWDPADGGNVDVVRNGSVVTTTADDGRHQDNLGSTTGTFTYAVCETDSGDCSNEIVVTIPAAFAAGQEVRAGEAGGAVAASSTAGEAFATAVLGVYPNPSGAATAVAFSLAERTPVELAVYNVLGQRVAVLVDAELGAGRHQASFDASALPGGVYVYRLQAGPTVQTGRVTVAH